MNRLVCVVLSTLSIVPLAVVAQQDDDLGLYLYKIPAESSASLSGTGASEPFARLHVADTTSMADHLADSAFKIVAIDDETITVTANTEGTVSGEPLALHLQSTFVVDFNEPAVTSMTQDLVSLHGELPDLNDLIQFTFDAIPDKTYLRNFDLASRVAEYGEGDCTEHAVLLTALTRATGRPARVMIGLLLVQDETDFLVLGHAWSEIHEAGRWQVADATKPTFTMPEATIRYLPLLQLSDEGPGYSFAMANIYSVFPSKVELVSRSLLEHEETEP